MAKKWQPEFEPSSPIAFHTGSNGEFSPQPSTSRDRQAEQLFRRLVDDRSRALGVSRRQFIGSACGTATALFVINQVYGCGNGGGQFAVDAGGTIDADQACEQLAGPDFVFDVQTHHVNPTGAWRDSGDSVWPLILAGFPQGSCDGGQGDPVDCFDRNHYIREVFINSDTSVAVISAVPAYEEENPLLAAEAAETRAVVDMLAGSPRLAIHGMATPDRGPEQLDAMQGLVEEVQIQAWKVYTQLGGWFLDDENIGIPFVEKARSLGVRIICAHKGLTLTGSDPKFASPRDFGVVAKAYPDTHFVAYHAGYETNITEGPYNPDDAQGTDRLIKSMQDNNIEPNSNIYAELGTTWRAVMTSPTEAAHLLGKLLLYVGEDNILWGTDSIWYGSPQPQIDAFRTFQISEELREAHGYPEITDEIRAKILGRNGATLYGIDPNTVLCKIKEDDLAKRREQLSERPALQLGSVGPRTRREFLSFLRARGGQPG